MMKKWLQGIESWARAFVWIFGMVLAIITVVMVLPVLTEFSRTVILISLILFLVAATIAFVSGVRRQFSTKPTKPVKGTPAKKEPSLKTSRVTGLRIPWHTYGWLEWSRFYLGIVLFALGICNGFLLHGCIELSIWSSSLGLFMLVHLLVIDSLIASFEVPKAYRPRGNGEKSFTMSTTRYWMETVRTLTYWTIAVSGVVVGILVGDSAEWTLLSKLGIVALGLAITSGFFYNIALIAAIQNEQGERLIVNRRRFAMGYFFFNLMFTSFVGGVVALVITVMT